MRLLSACLLALFPLFAFATEAAAPATAPQLPTVTVSATPDAVTTVPTAEAARAAQREVPGGASVIGGEEFRRGRAATPEDALRLGPGVFVASRFGSEEARLSVRGSGLQRTSHGRGLLLLQDGVPLNLADGSFDFQAVEPLALQYIGVYRGANAFRFGAAALGGAIDLVSPTGLDTEPELRLEGGSFGHRRAYAQVAAGGERGDVFLGAAHFGREGFQEHGEQDTQRFFANAGQRLSANLEHRFYFSRVETDSELPGSLTEAGLRSGQRRHAAPLNVQNDYKRDFELWRAAWKLNWRPLPAQRLEFSVFYSDKHLVHPIFQMLEQDSADYGSDLRWQHAAPFGRAGDRLILGTRLQRGGLDDDRFANVGGLPQARTDKSAQLAEQGVVYGEYDWQVTEDWTVVAGLQHVNATREFHDLFFSGASNPDRSFGRRYEKTLPRLGLLHELDAATQLFANVSGVYEPPSFGELSGGPGVDLLAAQEGVSHEIGARGEWAEEGVSGRWEAVLYRMQLEHELISYQVSPTATLTVNAGDTRHQGVELGMRLQLSHWEAALNYQFNDFAFDNDASYGDNAIAGVPAQVLNAELLYRFTGPRLYVGATLTAASSSWVDHRNRLQAPGYAVYGLKLGQQVTPALDWFLEGRNLADKTYAATHGVVVDATLPASGAPQRLFNPGDGRALYAGLSWKFR